MKIALLVVDMQKEFFKDEKCKEGLMAALEYINYSIDVFRKSENPIIFIQDKETSEAGYDLYEELDIQKKDIRVSKTFCNSFWETDLEEQLHKLEIEFVVICGFAAEYCVYATYNGAMERGFEYTLLQNGVASPSQKHADFIQSICRTTSIQALEYFLKASKNK